MIIALDSPKLNLVILPFSRPIAIARHGSRSELEVKL